MNRTFLLLLFSFLLLISCSEQATVKQDFYESQLFKDVQLGEVFPDSKTFVDCLPKKSLKEIQEIYLSEKSKSGFDLKAFVAEHFDLPPSPASGFQSDTSKNIIQHINSLWPVLTREPDDYNPNSSLIPLPHPYIVPGGRFSEIYYWDSYFTILGLQASGRMDMVRNMVDNFAFLIDTLGFIPNGNRNYYLSRSQPPYFSLMVRVLESEDKEALTKYLPALLKEYTFWMNGEEQLKNTGDAFEHVVRVSDGTILNRYWDKDPRPRPESYKEDVHLQKTSARKAEDLFLNLRAACESGWDFSSRWFEQGKGLESIRTTELLPVDLNSLLYHQEMMIARAYRKSGEANKADEFIDRANARRRAILTFMWEPEQQFFFDYHFPTQQRSHALTLAGAFPLYFNLVQPEIANAIAVKLGTDFLSHGGLRTTKMESGQQWDAPNGWAPLQWIAYKGLRNYEINGTAAEIKYHWLDLNNRVYEATGKMVEKYNVQDITLLAGGGEYPLQDGFGWSNGIVLAMMEED
jgi:alpha,alpha-trehalase